MFTTMIGITSRNLIKSTGRPVKIKKIEMNKILVLILRTNHNQLGEMKVRIEMEMNKQFDFCGLKYLILKYKIKIYL